METPETVTAPDSIGAGITANPGGKIKSDQKLWLKRIKAEQRVHKDFRDRAKVVEEVFNKDCDADMYVPLYWQVVAVEHSGVYSNQPNPDVRPRSSKQDPVMREIAMLIQRGLEYCVDQPGFDDNMHRSVDDYLAMALGVIRCKVETIKTTTVVDVPTYEDVMVEQPPIDMGGGFMMNQEPVMQTMQTGMEKQEQVTYGDQKIVWEHVAWGCFGYEPGNSWKHCNWIYFRHKMTMPEIIKRFGRPIAASKDNENKDPDSWKAKTYDIYEIWCKEKREVLFLAEGESEILDTIPDPLELLNFFPCPAPMMMNLPSDTLIPQPDYDYIEAYDVEINRLQIRRMALLEQLKATGAFDSGLPELGEMMENEDGEYTGVASLMQRLAAAGGAENAIYHLPLQEKAGVLQQLTEQITFVRSQVDEVLGISDIVRGVTAASETATAQEIKGRWVGVRLTRKRETVQYTVREMMRITAQLLVSHITPENLERMTQMTISEQTITILNNDILMDFAVDIETDSTVAKDEAREMQTKQEMLNGVAQYSQSVLPMVQQNLMPAGMAAAILRASLTPYAKYDRNLEQELATLPETLGQLTQLNQTLQTTQQQLQQAQGMAQQWEMVAKQLQEQATQATAAQKTADAQKKAAETESIRAKLPDDHAQAPDTRAATELKEAQTIETIVRADKDDRTPIQNPNQQGGYNGM